MKKKNILLIEDDPSFRLAIENFLTKLQFNVAAFSDAKEAIKNINENYDLILSDGMLPELSGYDVLKFVRKKFPEIPLILMTGYGTIEKAVEAMKAGAYDFLIKPFSLNVLETTIQGAFLDRQAKIDFVKKQDSLSNNVLTTRMGLKRISERFITRDKQMLDLIENLKKVAHSKATVLIQGESGTGKELIAKMVHEFSPRANRIFVAINCAAMPDTLLESELFGHEKGAFTGAVARQIGKFELSNNGTILLDEISEMSLTMQTKLLRVLQECEIYRVGGVKSIPLNLRVIATTNRDLYSYMKQGSFREDLYYRINVVPVVVPPLRDRGQDVIHLAKDFLTEFSILHGRKPLELNAAAKQKILDYPWYGNVRQLRNTMERAALVGSFDVIEESEEIEKQYNQKEKEKAPIQTDGLSLQEIEQKAILKALKAHHGNRTKTAVQLGISLRTLRNKLKSYGVSNRKLTPDNLSVSPTAP